MLLRPPASPHRCPQVQLLVPSLRMDARWLGLAESCPHLQRIHCQLICLPPASLAAYEAGWWGQWVAAGGLEASMQGRTQQQRRLLAQAIRGAGGPAMGGGGGLPGSAGAGSSGGTATTSAAAAAATAAAAAAAAAGEAAAAGQAAQIGTSPVQLATTGQQREADASHRPGSRVAGGGHGDSGGSSRPPAPSCAASSSSGIGSGHTRWPQFPGVTHLSLGDNEEGLMCCAVS